MSSMHNTPTKEHDIDKLSDLCRFAELGKLSSGLLHDLINPLTALSLYLDDIATTTKKPLSPEIRKKLETALLASKRMEDLIEIVRKQLAHEITKRTFSVCSELSHVIELLSHRATKERVSVELNCIKNIYLYGNPLCFYQIALNLISNAIDAYKYSASSNRIVEIACTQENHYLKLTVTDHRTGIPDEIIEHIFEPFFTTKDSNTGTGIGLCSTKNIVEKDFEGSISVISTRECGTLFTVLIPLTNYLN